MQKVWFDDLMWPECFDSPEQLQSWHQAMMQSKNTSYSVWVCIDCTPNFQKKMIEQGRCENPHIKFKQEYEHKTAGEIKDSEWSIIGFVPDDVYKQVKERKIREGAVFWDTLEAWSAIEPEQAGSTGSQPRRKLWQKQSLK